MELFGEAFRYCKTGTYSHPNLACSKCKTGYYLKKKTTN